MNIGLALAVVALVAAFVVPFTVEALERPRLEIITSSWQSAGPIPWTFATVQVRNRPLAAPLAKLLTRQAAQGCVILIDYFHWGSGERVIPTVQGRWTSHQELTEAIPHLTENTSTDQRYRDIPVSRAGEEIAVAVLNEESAYAFSSASYGYPAFGNPAWRLNRGTYRIAVRVLGSSVDREQVFKLEFLSNNFAQFRLQAI